LGRGTSTSDGFGLAWAIASYLYENIRCYGLFATHFHEMTSLEIDHPGIKNYFMTADILDG
jgi:DNA mismatch repair protein MSH2